MATSASSAVTHSPRTHPPTIHNDPPHTHTRTRTHTHTHTHTRTPLTPTHRLHSPPLPPTQCGSMMVSGSRDSDIHVWSGVKRTTWSPSLHSHIGREARAFVLHVLLVGERIKRTAAAAAHLAHSQSDAPCTDDLRGAQRIVSVAGGRRSDSVGWDQAPCDRGTKDRRGSRKRSDSSSRRSLASLMATPAPTEALPVLPVEMWLAILSAMHRDDMVAPSTAKPPGRQRHLRTIRNRILRRLSKTLNASLPWSCHSYV
jgi:hypothetical protein